MKTWDKRDLLHAAWRAFAEDGTATTANVAARLGATENEVIAAIKAMPAMKMSISPGNHDGEWLLVMGPVLPWDKSAAVQREAEGAAEAAAAMCSACKVGEGAASLDACAAFGCEFRQAYHRLQRAREDAS